MGEDSLKGCLCISENSMGIFNKMDLIHSLQEGRSYITQNRDSTLLSLGGFLGSLTLLVLNENVEYRVCAFFQWGGGHNVQFEGLSPSVGQGAPLWVSTEVRGDSCVAQMGSLSLEAPEGK